MNRAIPRLRMFAGPNGSGKSTIKSVIRPELLGVYVNADDLEQQVRAEGAIDVGALEVRTTDEEVSAFLRASTLLQRAALVSEARGIRFENGRLRFGSVAVNSYFASVVADFVRRNLMAAGTSFTFETVMSSPDKIEFLQTSRARGFRNYLYYVATGDPAVNVSRVANRVRLGGHSVPEEKIISRYHRSLGLLMDAIRSTSRAYIFDNSGRQPVWIAEITEGRVLEMKTGEMPAWFKQAVWDKIR